MIEIVARDEMSERRRERRGQLLVEISPKSEVGERGRERERRVWIGFYGEMSEREELRRDFG
jgi:hypothetical protein